MIVRIVAVVFPMPGPSFIVVNFAVMGFTFPISNNPYSDLVNTVAGSGRWWLNFECVS